ncbi:MAG TPA: carboxylating nicotinate-nucleotide diphosphorylase [Candidatus Scatavimonas merdigallinarum]|uniref:Probable nicotinate-nucleotide pyrophosphorylase [carboxylating] n=1 Tax=Candidatus Scatavimonas merdigallinarum TaxID=2840914 RepID=A0A9D0ZI67_9FIRM|nr:carboxylating nicotinate-nucleotide diphosphorylase [Candidatus Scatavimonas merdigallinarum]
MLNPIYIDNLIQTALLEDISYLDTTTDYLIPEQQQSQAHFLAKADGVLCGVDIAMRVFTFLQPGVITEIYKHDGDLLKKGDVIAKINGSTRALLKGERTALNLLQHLSGIATATHQAVLLTSGTKAGITDTRKTLPGLRPLQKYAVVTGGGKNHRYNLSDAAMLKDNHIDAAGGIANAVETLKGKLGHMVKIEVEVRTLEELQQALQAGADIIMLDNMAPQTMAQAVKITNGQALLEASGGITQQTLREIAQTGVDIISIGALTHSVHALDISMKITAP